MWVVGVFMSVLNSCSGHLFHGWDSDSVWCSTMQDSLRLHSVFNTIVHSAALLCSVFCLYLSLFWFRFPCAGRDWKIRYVSSILWSDSILSTNTAMSRKHSIGGDLNFILYVLQEKNGGSIVARVVVVQVVTKVSVIQKMVTAILWLWQLCFAGLKCHLNINCIVVTVILKKC